jgi:chromosome partitioning protein
LYDYIHEPLSGSKENVMTTDDIIDPPQKSLIKKNLPPPPRSTIADLVSLATSSANQLEAVREAMLEPYPRKQAPEFTATQVAALCGMDRVALKNVQRGAKVARGKVTEGSSQKTYTLKEAIEIIQEVGQPVIRPKGKNAKIISVCSYKGGVGKTTSSVQLAQGLTLKGLTVLLVDIDGQGSATMLCGISPELEVAVDDTIMPYIYGDQENLAYAVKETYWENLFLIPSSSANLSSEYVIPTKARDPELQKGGYRFWDELKNGLEVLMDEFDVIIIDTSPSLGYLTQNAMTCANFLLTPCPQDGLDFASLCQFWGVFAEISSRLSDSDKEYDLFEVFLTKSKSENDELAGVIKSWMRKAFPGHMWEIGIPDSSIPKIAAAELKTVYDLAGKDTSGAAYKRYKEPVDAFVDHIAAELAQAWRRD